MDDVMAQIYHGDCVNLAKELVDDSVQLVVCSPPYAMQRKSTYGGIPEKEYPEWTVKWLENLRPKIKEHGSVFMVIRPHLYKGQLSDYELRTRLSLRQAGWIEAETLIWHKPDAPPLGSILRPRRTWEYILWFSKSRKPYVDLKAAGNTESNRVGGFAGSERFGDGGDSPIHSGQKRKPLESGTSRCSDLVQVTISSMDRGVNHPAMYPQGVPEFLIKSFSAPGDLVLDPFCGSGQTGLAALRLLRRFVGFEVKEEYVQLANKRLALKRVFAENSEISV